jgi:hypothetical protein
MLSPDLVNINLLIHTSKLTVLSGDSVQRISVPEQPQGAKVEVQGLVSTTLVLRLAKINHQSIRSAPLNGLISLKDTVFNKNLAPEIIHPIILGLSKRPRVGVLVHKRDLEP